MDRLYFAAIVACVAFSWGRVTATDLAKIDRTIAKEPPYRSKPQYCLLVFGKEAKTRVWLVRDGDVLYVDRNGNGDLTEPGERVALRTAADNRRFDVGAIREQDGAATHDGLVVEVPEPGKKGPYQISVLVGGTRSWYSDNELQFGDSREKAPVIHFGGPLTLRIGDDQVLLRGNKPSDLRIEVVATGVGKGSFAAASYRGVTRIKDTGYGYSKTPLESEIVSSDVPPDIHPVVEIEFPNRDPGGKPIAVRYALKQRC